MRVNIPSYIYFIFLIKYISSQSQNIILNISDGFYNPRNHGASPHIDEPIVFDLNKFNLDQKIYIKISGDFSHFYIEYLFFDDINYLNNKQYSTSDLKTEYPIKYETKKDTDGNYCDINYYTIKIPTNNSQSEPNWNYLAVFAHMKDHYDIEIIDRKEKTEDFETNEDIETNEDLKKNKGNYRSIIITVVVVVFVVLVTGLLCYWYKRDKTLHRAQSSQGYHINNNNNVASNNNSLRSNENIIDDSKNIFKNNNIS